MKTNTIFNTERINDFFNKIEKILSPMEHSKLLFELKLLKSSQKIYAPEEYLFVKKIKLTKKQKEEKITLERFNAYHRSVGEDFLDQEGSVINSYMFAGYILKKYIEDSKNIIKMCNDRDFEMNSFTEYYDFNHDKLYTDLSEFINLTESTKERVNEIFYRKTDSEFLNIQKKIDELIN